jgi:starch synthase
VRILGGTLPGYPLEVLLVDIPEWFDRPGNPYLDGSGHEYGDNPQRFAAFACSIVELVSGPGIGNWRPDLVHCNDWQTGLVPALLSYQQRRPATLFTIHNLAYQGVYGPATRQAVGLPSELWHPDRLEFFGNLSFIKGGIVYADVINTVSPTYAREICCPELGYGLDGLLRHRRDHLFGILNGIDAQLWDPANDPNIPAQYDTADLTPKLENKRAVQESMGLEVDDTALLFGHIGRLVEQKGVDLIIEVLPRLMEQPNAQLAILGSGEPRLEAAITSVTERYPGRVAARLGYDEPLSHLIEAGSDCFLMPSRFEPCGLNQMYSLRYGTVPIVHRTGGLADTVIDTNSHTVLDGRANGFVFDDPTSDGLWWAIKRAIEFRRRPSIWWEKLMLTGMSGDASWQNRAKRYIDLYRLALGETAGASEAVV